MQLRSLYLMLSGVLLVLFGCNLHSGQKEAVKYRGTYSFGPEVKTFKDCDNGREFWVADSSAQLELKYSQMNFEKPYEPVYVEVEGVKVRSGKDGIGSEYDSTLIVRRVLKITKVIPQDTCN